MPPSQPASASAAPAAGAGLQPIDIINRRIEALKRDIALELDGDRKTTLQMRLAELEAERAQMEQTN